MKRPPYLAWWDSSAPESRAAQQILRYITAAGPAEIYTTPQIRDQRLFPIDREHLWKALLLLVRSLLLNHRHHEQMGDTWRLTRLGTEALQRAEPQA